MSQRPIDTSAPMRLTSVEADGRWGAGERLTADFVVGLLAWAIVALVSALVGFMHWWVVLPAALVVWALLRPVLPERSPQGRGLGGWWIAALALAVAVTAFNSLFPAEHLLTGRDSGTYMATAGWLAETGSLYVDAETESFEGFPELGFAVPGFYQRVGREMLEPQFMHAFPAMLGSLIDGPGLEASLRLNAVIGGVLLLAIFGLARRFMRSPAALLAAGALAASLVFVYYARAPFTELLMATFAIAGVWLLLVAEQSDNKKLGLLAGALIGAATVVRLDGVVLLVPVTAYLVFRAKARPELGATLRSARRGMFMTALIGLGESLWVSPAYVLERSPQVAPVLVAVLLLLLVSEAGGHPVRKLGEIYRENRELIFNVIVAASAVLLFYAWVVRPAFVEAPGGGYGLTAIQEREGLEVDSTRSYAEQSVRWIAWYQGVPYLILGFTGAVLLLRRSMFERGHGSDSLIVLILATFAALYLWRPSINPDHIWVMRRYLTVVLPFGAVAAGYAVDRTAAMVSSRFGGVSSGVTAFVLSALLIVPPIVTTGPSWDLAELRGLAADFEGACEEVGPESHVLVIGEALGFALTQGFRSYCGIPAAYAENEPSAAQLAAVSRSASDEGNELVVLTSGSGGSLFPGSYEFLVQTLSKPPAERANLELEIEIVD